MTILDKGWEKTQIKVFSRWCAKHLATKGIKFESVLDEFADGVKLIQLLEIIGKEPITGKWHKECKNRYHMIENVGMAIDYITNKKGIKLVNISPDDIVDKNTKLTLGLTWSCINKFAIEDISVEEATARSALLIWCQKNTQGYDGVNITNFTNSWSSGLAFCALINKFRPNLLDYNALDQSNHTNNCEQAFKACNEIGLTVYLDPEDLVDVIPDEKSVVTQVAEFFHFFAGESKVEQQAEKLKRTIGIQKEIADLKNTYAEEARAAIDAMQSASDSLLNSDYEKTVVGIKAKLIDVLKYTRNVRPNIVELRAKALRTWASLGTKCKTTGRPEPVAPEGLEPEVLTNKLNELDETAANQTKSLKEELKQAELDLINAYDTKCTELVQKCQDVHGEIDSISGSVEEQLAVLEQLKEKETGIRGEIEELKAPYEELDKLNLNTRAKYSTTLLESYAEQVASHIKHLELNIENLKEEEERNAKIQSYNQLANEKVEESKKLEEQVNGVDGENEEKREKLIQMSHEVEEKKGSVSELNAPYEELEQNDLQLDAEYTPDSIVDMFDQILAHINTLIAAIDSAIAAAKGLEIPEEQLAEFRETFKSFDSDNSNTLQYYELNACLTALGEPATDDECKDIINKYTGGAETLDFDNYVKFMLDRFSKAETKETTEEAFRAIAQNNPVVTEAQLQRFFSPEDVEFLKSELQEVDGGYDFASWVANLYA
ncbi:putative alpha-actinin [Histomonas meleagridis]|uniref:putative alpha-actinin n=1 Tax=Histomonas meleagridis TaxID=135588 RepID=UPI003559692F|nr:putative alpha-actinin [Histomonas meleagridis]KAH0800249.1 putative alpha-actinin [Histomonas meleagridis]